MLIKCEVARNAEVLFAAGGGFSGGNGGSVEVPENGTLGTSAGPGAAGTSFVDPSLSFVAPVANNSGDGSVIITQSA